MPGDFFNVRKPCRRGEVVFNRHDRYIGRSLELYGVFSEHEVELFGAFRQPASQLFRCIRREGISGLPIKLWKGPKNRNLIC